MKISDLNIGKAVEDGVWVDILMHGDRPDLGLHEGGPSGLRVRVRSTDSRQFREAASRLAKTALKRKAADISFEDAERVNVDAVLAATVDWQGIEDEDGQPLPFNEANGRRIYSDPGFKWIADQVNAASGERRRFFGS